MENHNFFMSAVVRPKYWRKTSSINVDVFIKFTTRGSFVQNRNENTWKISNITTYIVLVSNSLFCDICWYNKDNGNKEGHIIIKRVLPEIILPKNK